MNSNQIKIFLNIAKTLSFTETAQQLFLSQSTISKNIKNLEKELDVELIKRSHQKISLTKAGQLFYERMQRIDSEVQNLITELHETDKTIQHTVTIGYMDIPFEHEYLPLFIRLLAHHTNIDLRLRLIDPSNQEDLASLLINKKIDFLIYQKDYFKNHTEIAFTSFLSRPLSVMVGKNDPMYLNNHLYPNELHKRKLFIWQATNPLPALERLQYELKTNFKINNIKTISDSLVLNELIKLNKGLGIVPGILYDKEEKEIRYIPLEMDIQNIYGVAYTHATKRKEVYPIIIKYMKKSISIVRESW